MDVDPQKQSLTNIASGTPSGTRASVAGAGIAAPRYVQTPGQGHNRNAASTPDAIGGGGAAAAAAVAAGSAAQHSLPRREPSTRERNKRRRTLSASSSLGQLGSSHGVVSNVHTHAHAPTMSTGSPPRIREGKMERARGQRLERRKKGRRGSSAIINDVV